jgi:poly(3-hydroxyalkanoate) depolymerase
MCSTTELRSITVGGTTWRFHIRHTDRTGRRPLVVANGIGASLELLQPFVDALPADVEVVRFDVPGTGGSPTPPRPYLMCELAHRLGTALDQLGYGEVDLLGVSWGGALAQQVALTQSRVRRLVLVSTAAGSVMIPASPRVLRLMITPRRYRDRDYAARVAGTIYGGRMRTHPDDAAHLLGDTELRVRTTTGYWMQILAIAGWTSLPYLPRLRQPTLILAGDDDPIIRLTNARIMARLIPNAGLHVYPDGHLALVTNPTALAPIITTFLAA